MCNQNVNNREKSLEWHCVKHENVKNCIEECWVQRIFNLFGKKYVMLIVRFLLINKKMRFNQISEELKGSPKTITSRLRDLEEFGLIKRAVFNEIPMRVEYSLTDTGKSLEDIFERFALWALDLKESK